MNPRLLLNIALAAAVAATAAGLYLLPREEDADTSYALVPVAAETLRRIEIQRGSSPSVVLERGETAWRMSAPYAARLDEIALGRLLDLTRLRTPARMTPGDRARFELDQPWASVRFDQHVIEFGATNALTQELYLASGEYVYAVPARAAAAVPSVPARLLAHRLFAADETLVAIALARFSLRHDGTRWQLDPPDPGLSQDDLVRWVDQWRLAGSVTTQPAADERSQERITVELRGGRAITLDVVQRLPDLVLVRGDEALAYHLPARLADVLLSPPNAAPHTSTIAKP